MDRDNIWQPKQRIETEFFRSIMDILEFLRKAIEGESDPYRVISILKNSLYVLALEKYAQETASRMVTHLFVENAKSWRQAARKGGRGRIIYAALKRELSTEIGGEVYYQIRRNAELIKTLPLDIAGKVTDYIAREALKGRRASDMVREIREKFPEITHAKAQLIARTEVSKTWAALTRARAESIGLQWYEWRTSEDQRVRSSHKHMNRILVNWNNPPSPEKLIGEKNPPPPYHAGEIWNCRCYAAPLTGIDRVSWPHKVYYGSAIVTMTKAEFEALNQHSVL